MSSDHGATPDAQILTELAWVRSLARRLLADASLADDVAQDTWLAARLHAPAAAGGVRSWLAAVAKNRVHRLVRSDRRRLAREVASAVERASENPADVVERAALHREMTAAVMELDEPYRSAVLLRYLDEVPAPEIARRQGVTHDAARKRISRGLQMLRERLEHLHPGGFAAWSLAWTRHLPVATTAATAGAGLVLPIAIAMNLKYLLTALAAVAAFSLWMLWPAPDSAMQTVAVHEPAVTVHASGPVDDPKAAQPNRESALGAEPHLAVDVVDERQQPCAHVLVFALRDGRLAQRGVTDLRGHAELALAPDASELLLARRGAVPVRVPLSDESGPQRVVFAAGHEVAGEVRGEESPVLRLQHDAVDACWSGLGVDVLRALSDLGIWPGGLELEVAADRTFAFAGLPANWTGALTTKNGWSLREPTHLGAVEAEAMLLLLAPTRGLVLELQAPVLLRGRLLAGGQPIAGLEVAVLEQIALPDELPRTETGSDGRFELGLRRPSANARGLRAELLVDAGHGGTLLQKRVEAAATDQVVDVGDLEVGKQLTVQVLGSDGQPFAGASVHVSMPSGLFVGVRSDAQGLAHFEAVPADASRLGVEAPRHRRVHLEIPASRELTVHLQRANEIEVHVTESDGAPATQLRLRVQSDRLPFALPAAAAAEAVSMSAKPFEAVFDLDVHGLRLLTDLEPGVLLHLVALDNLGQEVGHLDAVAPPPERCDIVELHTTQRSFYWRGTVRDENGRAVPRARVHCEAGHFALDGRSGADGRFELGPLQRAVEEMHVEVVHPAFVTWLRNGITAAPDAPELDVMLVRGRNLRARVLQQNGQPAQSTSVYVAIDGGGAGIGKLVEPGVYDFENLARLPGTLTVTLGGRDFTAPVAPHAEDVELRVPDLATISVQMANAADAVAGARLCVVVTPLEPAGEVDRHYFPPSDTAPAPISLQLPPGRYRVQLERRRFGARVKVDLLGEARELAFAGGEYRELLLP